MGLFKDIIKWRVVFPDSNSRGSNTPDSNNKDCPWVASPVRWQVLCWEA